mgnify:CR=1 FL=1
MFIEKADFNTHIYEEVINAITRDTDTIFTDSINAAIEEAEGYLSKYNTDLLFNTSGSSRSSMLVLVCKDLTCWHFIALANPNLEPAMFRTRYEDAIRWLKDVQCGKIVPKGWTKSNTSDGKPATNWNVTSNPRRETRY